MANVKVILNVNMAGNGEINIWNSDEFYSNNKSPIAYSNNIKSMVDLFDSSYKNFTGAKTYGVNYSKIGQKRIQTMQTVNGYENNDYKGITFKPIAFDSNGYPITSELIMDIEGVDILNFKIYFDNYMQQYPKRVVVYLDGRIYQTLTPNSSIVFVENLPTGEHDIRIVYSQWNNPNAPVSITFIEFPKISIILNKSSIMEIRTQTQFISDNAHIHYGILANTGSMSIYDIKGRIYQKAMLGYFDANKFTAEIYLNNNLIQMHYSTSTPYFDANASMDIQFTNKISLWRDIEIPEKIYSEETTLYQIFYDVITQDNTIQDEFEIKSMLNKKILINNQEENYETITIEQYMKNIYVPPFTLKKDNLLNQINKICTVAQLNACINDVGQIKFFNARPVATDKDLEEVIIVPFQKQREKMSFNLLKDNKYNKVAFK